MSHSFIICAETWGASAAQQGTELYTEREREEGRDTLLRLNAYNQSAQCTVLGVAHPPPVTSEAGNCTFFSPLPRTCANTTNGLIRSSIEQRLNVEVARGISPDSTSPEIVFPPPPPRFTTATTSRQHRRRRRRRGDLSRTKSRRF